MPANIAISYPQVNSFLLLSGNRLLLDHSAMFKPVEEIRREYFAAHVDKHGGIVKFADAREMNEDYVRQLYKGWTNIGTNKARELESALGDQPNQWDQDREIVMDAKKNDRSLEEIRQAIGALYVVVAALRPNAGLALSAALHAKAPPEMLAAGSFLDRLDASVRSASRKAQKRAIAQ